MIALAASSACRVEDPRIAHANDEKPAAAPAVPRGQPHRWSGRVLASLQPRTIVVYMDLSGSMRAAALQEPLARLARELRPRDHLVLYPITAYTASELTPLLDTLLTGSLVDQVTSQLGLATRISRTAVRAEQQRLAEHLALAARAARTRYGRASSTSIIDAVCDAGRLARIDPSRATTALLITDGIEESAFINVAATVPDVGAARRLAGRLRTDVGCDLGAAQLTVRLVGVRHPRATAGLTRWWTALLRELGYEVALDDVATHRLRPLLSTR